MAALTGALCLIACSTEKPATKGDPPKAAAPAVFKVDTATAGAIAGRVLFAGKRPANKRIDLSEDEECVKLNRRGMVDQALVVNRDGSLRNVFVHIKTGLEGKNFERPSEPVVLDQKGCQFAPRVLGMRAGQAIQVTNSDPVTHNVHPVAQMNREWNQSQAPGDPPIERKFVRPEVMIRVKCNVHNWMRSWVAVMEHPYFAVSGEDGTFSMPNVPPGDYTVEAWHETLGTQTAAAKVDASGKATLEFAFK
jgi:plastocyanin